MAAKKPQVSAHVVQGSCLVYGATMRPLGPNSQQWDFDMRAKRAEVIGISNVDVLVDRNDSTLHYEQGKMATNLWFKMPAGWRVLSAEVSRYTLRCIVGKHDDDAWKPMPLWLHSDHQDKKPTTTEYVAYAEVSDA